MYLATSGLWVRVPGLPIRKMYARMTISIFLDKACAKWHILFPLLFSLSLPVLAATVRFRGDERKEELTRHDDDTSHTG
jgi:hypothetical protein